MKEFLQWAKYYHARGLHPIPIEVRGKRPILASWSEYFTRQPTIEELERWWGETPDANVGLIQGRGAFVLDIDGPEGEAALAAAGVEIPTNAPQVTSSPGKRHVYFAGVAPNVVGILEKVDTRSDGGYVVAPPSIHPCGAPYAWASNLWPPPPAPPRLLELLQRPRKPTLGPKADTWLLDALAGVGEGQRDIMCARLSGYLWGKGLPQDAVEGFMQLWAEACTPAFPTEEVTKTVVSICKREGGPAAPPAGIETLVAATVARILAPPEKRPPVASTSLKSLDEILDGGFFPGNFILLAARPSVGKTALAVQIARASGRKGSGVLFCSLEMTQDEIVQWMLVQESGIPQQVLQTGVFPVEAMKQGLLDAAARVRELPLWITPTVYTGEDLHETLAGFEPGVLGLVIVDYLQIMSSAHLDGRARIEHISKMIKRAAVKYRVPIMALSSLSRPPKDNPNWRPQLGDLRESGQLEHDADIVVMLHRELTDMTTEVFVRKHRGGRIGQLRATFTGAHLTFEGA